MTITLLSLFLQFVSAGEGHDHGNEAHQASYYVGQQFVGILDSVPCFVEAEFEEKGQHLNFRGIITDPHNPDAAKTLGPVELEYSQSDAAYLFSTDPNTDGVELVSLKVSSSSLENPNEFEAQLKDEEEDDGHGHDHGPDHEEKVTDFHFDDIKCENLASLNGAEKEQAEELFEHFDEIGQDDHGHGGHDHHDH